MWGASVSFSQVFVRSLLVFLARLCWGGGGGGSVAIVRIRAYTSDIVIGMGIIYCMRGGSQTVVRDR